MKIKIMTKTYLAIAVLIFVSFAADETANARFTPIECSFMRTSTCSGAGQSTKGKFFCDKQTGALCYDYDDPFHYRFIITDTSLFGIDKKTNTGYVASRRISIVNYSSLFRSLHIFDTYLRNIAQQGTLRASIGDDAYYEIKTGNGSEVVVRNRVSRAPALIECFDASGSMFEQVKLLYDINKPKLRAMVVRRRAGALVTTDSVTINSLSFDKQSPKKMFEVPAGCVLSEKK